ncbi:MAG: HU family DNA-binding protein [Bacillota bacterium]|nr:HU family DNA-binding protein [Clostridia bacterium]
MNKTDLINSVSEKAEVTKKDAEKVINAVFASISEALAANEKVQLVGFGTFEVKERAARVGRNPQTGETINIAAARVPTFKAGKGLKDAVAK